ncbi:hypothetical protein [Limosilactobacillus equigenerosi]|uniref:Uncharacterized protein n=1 Tax=Limosilactobacillus equigenerosi DSM 18793 = JCM 14505 TaxID=1423742 RepID=A0A0R1UGT6_9LACO|nr:hypothetical protein [Limosilactobacillus equigenerosi]KRL92604.1 hypothetical protein FC21_GL000197 [Limosilactobacillus equigenerosi DSM 18793 = JCM 14505]
MNNVFKPTKRNLIILGILILIIYPVYNFNHFRFYYIGHQPHPKYTYPFIPKLRSFSYFDESSLPGYSVSTNSDISQNYTVIKKNNIVKKGDLIRISSQEIEYFSDKDDENDFTDEKPKQLVEWALVDNESGKITSVYDNVSGKDIHQRKMKPEIYTALNQLEQTISNARRPLINLQWLYNIFH